MSKLTDHLTTLLADTYALGIKTHGAHWNVTGPEFFALHEAFDVQYQALFAAADEVSERLRALGERAPTGIQALTKATSIVSGKDDRGLALAKALGDDHRALSKSCAQGVKLAQQAGDEASADLLIGRIEEHDKTAWMLDAVSA